MEDGKIVVVGIPDLQKALRQMDKDLPRELAAGLAEAAEIVAEAARPLVPHRSGSAAGSIKVKKQQRAAALGVGGNEAPYFPWLDFGGQIGAKSGKAKGDRGRRPFFQKGRYIYPTLSRKNKQVKAKVDEVLERMARRAGFETEGDAAK